MKTSRESIYLELKTDIGRAILDNQLEVAYPKLLIKCQKYNISSYTLQQLICAEVASAKQTFIEISPERSKNFELLTPAKNDNKVQIVEVVKYKTPMLAIATIILLCVTIIIGLIEINERGGLIQHLEYENIKLTSQNTILSKKNASSELFLQELESVSYRVGEMKNENLNSFDRTYTMWIDVKCPIIIDSMYVKAKKDGEVIIELYDELNDLKHLYNQHISGGKFQLLKPNFVINQAGKYYLKLDSSSVELCYNSSSDNAYKGYKDGGLTILGCPSNGSLKKQNSHSYYQYYYEIYYSMMLSDKKTVKYK